MHFGTVQIPPDLQWLLPAAKVFFRFHIKLFTEDNHREGGEGVEVGKTFLNWFRLIQLTGSEIYSICLDHSTFFVCIQLQFYESLSTESTLPPF